MGRSYSGSTVFVGAAHGRDGAGGNPQSAATMADMRKRWWPVDGGAMVTHAGGMQRIATKPGSSALRAGRVSRPGQVYLVTAVVRGRRAVFAEWPAARAVSRVLGDTGLWWPHQCLAWVLMPDHWHGLVQLGLQGDLSAVMCKMKSASAREWGCQQGVTGGLWQAGFHDRAIRRQQDVRKAARYVVANPLRAGLVTDVLQYPYWDAVWMGPVGG